MRVATVWVSVEFHPKIKPTLIVQRYNMILQLAR